ncbi:hypothetical protein PFISCL1PPCAC_29187, partial [Pristionchus fissidentatus]
YKMGQFDGLKASLDEHIQGVNRYNPENVMELQQCIAAMANENRYCRDIALTTLKLYQLNPDKYDETTVRLILLKTLTVLPGADFALAKCLIDANRINTAELRLVLALGSVLESCDFPVFWKLIKGEYTADDKFKQPAEVGKLIKQIAGFEEAVRIFACKVISTTFQCIERPQLVRLLGGANDQKIAEYCKSFGWEQREGGAVLFIANHDSTIRSRNIDEKLSFNNVHEVLVHTPVQMIIE